MVPGKDRTKAPGLARGSVEKETAIRHPGWDRKPWVSSAEKEAHREDDQDLTPSCKGFHVATRVWMDWSFQQHLMHLLGAFTIFII